MTQNLDYDLSVAANRTLVPATSNVTTTRTITLSGVRNEGGQNEVYHKDNGNIYLPNGNNSPEPIDCTQLKNEQCHYHAGDYYSWRTATAGQGTTSILSADMNESICPKDWILPRGSTYGNYTFGNLTNLYSLTNSGNGTNGAQLMTAPLYMAFYGNNWNNNESNTTHYTLYWTASATSKAEEAYYFHAALDEIIPVYTTVRNNGFPIRCVAL